MTGMLQGVDPSRIEVRGRAPRGFSLFRGYVPDEDQQVISSWIEANVPWDWGIWGAGSQDYGGPDEPPPWSLRLAKRFVSDGIHDRPPTHVRLMRYDAAGGVPAHIDHPSLGEAIVALTLGSTRILQLTRKRGRALTEALLFPGDLYVLAGDARYRWMHGVPYRSADDFGGRTYPRSACISVVWRQVNPKVWGHLS